MPKQKPKVRWISKDDYLKALALFTMGNRHYVEGSKYERALMKHLGITDEFSSHLGGAILGDDPDFDEALAKDGVKGRR